jgi:hypothetical protein
VIVFKDLQKLVSQQQKESTRKELFQRPQGKPFWMRKIEGYKLEDIQTGIAGLITSFAYHKRWK